MLILRLRQSEVALGDGRLDEAYALAATPEFAAHRRGQRVIDRLVEALLKRGQEHLAAGQLAQGLTDCEKAAKLGGNLPEVVALRTAVANGLRDQQHQQNVQQMAVAAARREIDQGHLDRGEKILQESPTDSTRVQLLKGDIENRKTAATAAVKAAKAAMDRGELHLAADEICRAKLADANDSGIWAMSGEVCEKLRKEISSAIEQGSLERADNFLRRLAKIDGDGPESRELASQLGQMRQIWRLVGNGDFSEARVLLARLEPSVGGAKWLRQAAEQVESARRAMEQLKAGPLAMLGMVTELPPRLESVVNGKAVMGEAKAGLPSMFVLHVDGVGSFLVLRQAVVTIGPISSSVAADVGVIAEPNLPAIQIQRVEDDYFLKTGGVNKLLSDGERLELSPRCRMRFAVPSSASTSAVLELDGARLARPDIRRVILMDQDVIIGSGGAHVKCDGGTVVLHTRDGQMFCRSGANVVGPMELGRSVSAGGLSLVASGVNDRRG